MSRREQTNNDCTCNRKLASLEKRIKALEKSLAELQTKVGKELETIRRALKR